MKMMMTVASAQVEFLIDENGNKKMRVNIFKNGKTYGFMKPVVSFKGEQSLRKSL